MITSYKLVETKTICGKPIAIYGSLEHPIFLQDDICEITGIKSHILYEWVNRGDVNGHYIAYVSGRRGRAWVLTKDTLSLLIHAKDFQIDGCVVAALDDLISGMDANKPRTLPIYEIADNAVVPFYSDVLGIEVRVTHKGGNPYFICNDIMEFFGYSHVNFMLHVTDPEDRCHFYVDGERVAAVNESGLFSIILASKHKDARTFKRWITSSVLPSLRNPGTYTASELLDNPDLMIQVLEQLKRERANNELLNKSIQTQARTIAELEPKAEYYDKVLSAENAVPISVIAKELGKSAMWLNKKLHELKIQYRRGNMWVLYQQYADRGYTTTRTHYVELEDGSITSRTDTVWTQAGREFIWRLLGKEDENQT